MTIQVLNRAQAFGPGAKLWIIPQEQNFDFHKKINWYLNFQLSRAKHHSSEDLSPQLRNIANQNQLPSWPAPQGPDHPLMVIAENFFPTEIIIEMPGSKDFKKWLQKLTAIWKDLNFPELRIFLPEKSSADDFKTIWKNGKEDLVSIVPC